ncbi:MAG: CBS domain-containing protein [Verrucomicrobia bacterium]|nr:MAG: CBS domain-containing protein [Verrucomicrobiota bacterium]
MTTVQRILDTKGRDVFTCTPQDTVLAAAARMTERGVGALLVADAKGQPVGIITERDLLRKVVSVNKSHPDLKVADIMSKMLWTVTPEQNIDECMKLMTERRIRHLPVVQHDKLLGLISIGDVVKHLLSEKDFIINQLETYIKAG